MGIWRKDPVTDPAYLVGYHFAMQAIHYDAAYQAAANQAAANQANQDVASQKTLEATATKTTQLDRRGTAFTKDDYIAILVSIAGLSGDALDTRKVQHMALDDLRLAIRLRVYARDKASTK